MRSIDQLVADLVRIGHDLRRTRGMDFDVEAEHRERFRELMSLSPLERIQAIQALHEAGAMGLDFKVLLIYQAVEQFVLEGEAMDTIDAQFQPRFAEARAAAGLRPDEYPMPEEQPPAVRAVFRDYFATWRAKVSEVMRSVGEPGLADLHMTEDWEPAWRALVDSMRSDPETTH